MLTWTQSLREHGQAFLGWLQQESVLLRRGRIVAEAVRQILHQRVTTPEDAHAVWAATPSVLQRCNEQSTYADRFAPVAYAWLHLLDRYARTWRALEQLVEAHILSLGKEGVRTLDIGTGPGPSALAIADFYSALSLFADEKKIARLKQPCSVDCIEYDRGTNDFRHHLAEVIYSKDRAYSKAVLSLCWAMPDFGRVNPAEQRRDMRRSLLATEDRVWDPIDGVWTWEPRHTPSEANDASQASLRYRLFVFSNFLTNLGTVAKFEPNISSLLTDAHAGSVVVVLGGKGQEYPDIYRYVNRLAAAAGFDVVIQDVAVSASNTSLETLVFEEGRSFYKYLQLLSRDQSSELSSVHQHFSSLQRAKDPSSHVRAYRKQRSAR